MPRYLIEVPHEPTKEACVTAIKAFMNSGSHFLTHADWGCNDDTHAAWLVVDLEDKEQARAIIPPLFRDEAKIVKLKQYTFEEIAEDTDKSHY